MNAGLTAEQIGYVFDVLADPADRTIEFPDGSEVIVSPSSQDRTIRIYDAAGVKILATLRLSYEVLGHSCEYRTRLLSACGGTVEVRDFLRPADGSAYQVSLCRAHFETTR